MLTTKLKPETAAYLNPSETPKTELLNSGLDYRLLRILNLGLYYADSALIGVTLTEICLHDFFSWQETLGYSSLSFITGIIIQSLEEYHHLKKNDFISHRNRLEY